MAIKRYVLVRSGAIGNEVEWVGLGDDDWHAANPLAIQVGAGKDVAPGFIWAGGTSFSRPTDQHGVPTEVSRKGLRRVLADNECEFDDLKVQIRALPNPRRRWLLSYLEETAYFKRSDPELMDMLTNLRSFTAAQVDLMFIAALIA